MSTLDSRSGFSPSSSEVVKPISFDVDFGTLGKEDTKNEDNHFFNLENMSFGIFDGMGGEANGQKSSQFCSDLIQTELKGLPTSISPEDAALKLKEITLKVSQSFLENKSKFNLGGSTGTFGIICSDKLGKSTAVIANLGDSRAYLYRPGNREPLVQLTTDDDAIENKSKSLDKQKQFDQIKINQLKKELSEIKKELDNASSENDLSEKGKISFGMRNQIGNYFGRKNEDGYQPNIVSVILEKGDVVLLTTDGVHDNLTSGEISKCISENKNSASQIVTEIIKRAALRSRQVGYLRAKPDDETSFVIIPKN